MKLSASKIAQRARHAISNAAEKMSTAAFDCLRAKGRLPKNSITDLRPLALRQSNV